MLTYPGWQPDERGARYLHASRRYLVEQYGNWWFILYEGKLVRDPHGRLLRYKTPFSAMRAADRYAAVCVA